MDEHDQRAVIKLVMELEIEMNQKLNNINDRINLLEFKLNNLIKNEKR